MSSRGRLIAGRESEIFEARLSFDDTSGFLRRVETRRFELRAGYPRAGSAELTSYSETGGMTVPTSIATAWEDEPALRLQLDHMELRG